MTDTNSTIEFFLKEEIMKYIVIFILAWLLAGCSNGYDLNSYDSRFVDSSRPTAEDYRRSAYRIPDMSITMSNNISNTHFQRPEELLPTYGDQSIYGDNQDTDITDYSAPRGEESITDNSDASHEAVTCVAEGKNLTPQQLNMASVEYQSDEQPGTLIIQTGECAAYYLLGNGKAARIRVAVGKEGFGWEGVAYVHGKRVDPTWTPPSEMIARRPELAKWAQGMPGGLPENPLGTRAMYLYDENGNDTMYRIHGTAEPQSIGHRASSGCIRVYPGQIEELFDHMPIGAKVIVTS